MYDVADTEKAAVCRTISRVSIGLGLDLMHLILSSLRSWGISEHEPRLPLHFRGRARPGEGVGLAAIKCPASPVKAIIPCKQTTPLVHQLLGLPLGLCKPLYLLSRSPATRLLFLAPPTTTTTTDQNSHTHDVRHQPRDRCDP